MNTIQFWLSNVSLLVLAVNVVLAALAMKDNPAPFRWFTYFLIAGLAVQLLAKLLWLREVNNLPLLHFYTLVEFVFISLFYRGVFQANGLRWAYFGHFIGLVALLILLNSIFIQPVLTFNSISKTVTQLIYISFAVTYFFVVPNRTENNFFTLISSAILVYYSGSLFIFMFTNVVSTLQDLYRYFWLANTLLYFLFQLIILHGLWKKGFRQMKYSP